MSDIFNSSHFLRGTNEVLPGQPRNPGRSRNLLEQEGKALHIANLLFLPFYLLPFYLLRRTENLEEVKLTLRLLGESIAHCKSLDFTFLPFTFLPFEVEHGPGRGETHTSVTGRGKNIAHCKYLDFTFLPFTFLPFEGGRRTWKRETHTSVTGGRTLHIANTLTLPFYLLPFYLAPISELYK